MTTPEMQHGHNNQTNHEMKTGSQNNKRGRQNVQRETQNEIMRATVSGLFHVSV